MLPWTATALDSHRLGQPPSWTVTAMDEFHPTPSPPPLPQPLPYTLNSYVASGLVMRVGRWFPDWVPGSLGGESWHRLLGAPSCVLKFFLLLPSPNPSDRGVRSRIGSRQVGLGVGRHHFGGAPPTSCGGGRLTVSGQPRARLVAGADPPRSPASGRRTARARQ